MKLKTIFFFALISSKLALAQNTFPTTGNVGIGVSNPSAKLEIKSEAANTALRAMGDHGYLLIDNVGSGESYYNANSAHRFQGSSNKEVFTIMGAGNVGIGISNPSAKLEIKSEAANTALRVMGDHGYLLIDNVGSGESYYNANSAHRFQGSSNKEVFTIMGEGNVGIGNSSPTEKLSVNGKIRAKEVKVEAANWPDYVFEEGYQTQSLSELENYIKTNKHLPDMPTAKEIETNGVAVGDMLKLQQKKIEELTLHLIEKDKAITELFNRMTAMEKKLQK